MTDRTRGLKDILWFLVFFGIIAMAFRLWYGLGATTNLTDDVPWGLWKILNMVAGVALATSGFTIGFLVYVLRIESLRPMVKPAILVAFLGYGSSVFALLLDIGIPHRIWHALVMWNEHSFLFEVAWCVMLYFTVTVIELSPVVLDRFGLRRLSGFLHRIAFGVVIIGISLSSLHHSSLGSLFLVTPQRLHPLWFTPRLPFLFILSAMAAGLMVAVLARLFYSRFVAAPAPALSGPDTIHVCAVGEDPAGRDLPMLRKLVLIAAGIQAVYLVLKVADLYVTGAVSHLLAMTWESYFYLGEVLLLAVLPLALTLQPRVRRSALGLGIAAGSTALGLVWNRLNVGIFGYFHDAGTVYLPSLAEWALSLGILAAAGLVFLYVSEYLPIFTEAADSASPERPAPVPTFDRLSGVWNGILASGLRRASAIAVLTVPLAWALLYPPFHAGPANAAQVSPPKAFDIERAVLVVDGNRGGLAVRFPHHDHQKRLGGEGSCTGCHHLSLPKDHSTPCSRCHQQMKTATSIFNHTAHMRSVAVRDNLGGLAPENHSCAVCHQAGAAKNAASAISCLECHQDDMKPNHANPAPHFLQWAAGYQTAMHKTCIGRHLEQAANVGRKDLGECATCHTAARPGPAAAQLVAYR